MVTYSNTVNFFVVQLSISFINFIFLLFIERLLSTELVGQKTLACVCFVFFWLEKENSF